METPSRPFVGLHYDIARGAYLKTQFVHEAIRLAARSGYTHFMPYLENMIRLPSMEKACPPCAYSGDDWRGFETTAKSAGIELVPWFNVIGHTKDIGLAYPELAGFADRGAPELDPERKVTKDWTLRCLDEFAGLSDSGYFVIGGDEWQTPNHLLARPGFDPGQAWVDQVNLAARFLAGVGKRPIVTHDMLWNYPHVRDQLSRDVIVLFWYYLKDSDYAALDTLKKWGFTTMMFTCGQCGPALSPRCVDGIRTALLSSRRHRPDMLALSTWEDCRWEQQLMQIPQTGRLLQGLEMDPDLLAVTARAECLERLDPSHPQALIWAREINEGLGKPAWAAYPELRNLISSRINNDPHAELESYLRFHHPHGPTYATLKARAQRPAQTPPATATSSAPVAARPSSSPSSAFGLEIRNHPNAGEVLHFVNGDESFDLYPVFGASLMDWKRGDDVIIPGGVDRFFARPRYPRGYRSYTNIGGFRPIWALGTHMLPNIIWHSPYRWTVVEETATRISVECRSQFPHVDIALRTTIERGRSGFLHEPSGLNKLPDAHVSFHWNLPVTFSPEEVSLLRFQWDDDGTPRESTIAQECSGNIMLEARGPLTIVRKPWTLRLSTDPRRTFGYLVDWHPSFITPDLHEVYQPVKIGETYSTSWRLELV